MTTLTFVTSAGAKQRTRSILLFSHEKEPQDASSDRRSDLVEIVVHELLRAHATTGICLEPVVATPDAGGWSASFDDRLQALATLIARRLLAHLAQYLDNAAGPKQHNVPTSFSASQVTAPGTFGSNADTCVTLPDVLAGLEPKWAQTAIQDHLAEHGCLNKNCDERCAMLSTAELLTELARPLDEGPNTKSRSHVLNQVFYWLRDRGTKRCEKIVEGGGDPRILADLEPKWAGAAIQDHLAEHGCLNKECDERRAMLAAAEMLKELGRPLDKGANTKSRSHVLNQVFYWLRDRGTKRCEKIVEGGGVTDPMQDAELTETRELAADLAKERARLDTELASARARITELETEVNRLATSIMNAEGQHSEGNRAARRLVLKYAQRIAELEAAAKTPNSQRATTTGIESGPPDTTRTDQDAVAVPPARPFHTFDIPGVPEKGQPFWIAEDIHDVRLGDILRFKNGVFGEVTCWSVVTPEGRSLRAGGKNMIVYGFRIIEGH